MRAEHVRMTNERMYKCLTIRFSRQVRVAYDIRRNLVALKRFDRVVRDLRYWNYRYSAFANQMLSDVEAVAQNGHAKRNHEI